MTNLGLNIPPGFTITTEACLLYFRDPAKVMKDITPDVMNHIKELESQTGKIFGDINNPLLVSIVLTFSDDLS